MNVYPNVNNTGVSISINNIVSRVDLGCKLDLKHISRNGMNCIYQEKFRKVVMRLRKPKATALIFSTGKMLCLGSKLKSLSVKASRRIARMIQKLGYPVEFNNFTVVNIIASCKLNFGLNLENLAPLIEDAFYEPEIFPGFTTGPFTCFVSGKVILRAKTKDGIFELFTKIYPIFLQVKRDVPVDKKKCSVKQLNFDEDGNVKVK